MQFTSEPAKAFARRLRAQRGKNIWMMGGGQLIASFLDAGEIDELDLHVIPVLIGKGIPLIAPRHRDIELRLIAATSTPTASPAYATKSRGGAEDFSVIEAAGTSPT